MIQTNTKSGCF